jgi:hypothetical protein
VFPAQIEACNGIDDNCDGQTDVPGSANCVDYYADVDGDTWPVDFKQCLCAPYDKFTAKLKTPFDCVDVDINVNPGLPEKCGGGDENCNGLFNEDDASGCVKYWPDADGDGFGAGTPKCKCAPDATYKVKNGDDCFDLNGNVKPGQGNYFTSHRGDGNFDYDCSGTTNYQYPNGGGCSNNVFSCGTNQGFTGSPGCGQAGAFLTSCSWSWFSCNASTETRTQACK